MNGFSPRMPSETSSVAVLPMTEAPACSSRSTIQAWRAGTGCARSQSGLPPPVGTPATSIRSFTAKREAGEDARGGARDMAARARHEGIQSVVGCHIVPIPDPASAAIALWHTESKLILPYWPGSC